MSSSLGRHVEAGGEPAETTALARELGLGVGLALNRDTPVEQTAAVADGGTSCSA